MVRRRETRLRTVLPVRVFGMDSNGRAFTVLAHTLDITNRGARIGGLKHPVSVGEIVGLQRGTDKARFRVVWVGTEEARNPGQAGLECVQENKNIWNVVLDDLGPDTFDVSSIQASVAESPIPTKSDVPERRRFLRYTCDIGVEMQVEGSDVCIFARCTDISRGGCYIETRSPFPIDTQVFLCMKVETARVRALGQVRSSHPALGMGVRFEEIGEDDRRFLDALLEQFECGKKMPPTTGLVSRLKENIENLRRVKEEVCRYPLDKASVTMLCAMVDVTLGALEAAGSALQEKHADNFLRGALQEHRIKTLLKIVQSIRQEQPNSENNEQIATIRRALESPLEGYSPSSRASMDLAMMDSPPPM